MPGPYVHESPVSVEARRIAYEGAVARPLRTWRGAIVSKTSATPSAASSGSSGRTASGATAYSASQRWIRVSWARRRCQKPTVCGGANVHASVDGSAFSASRSVAALSSYQLTRPARSSGGAVPP